MPFNEVFRPLSFGIFINDVWVYSYHFALCFLFFFFCLFVLLFRAAPAAYGGSQARGQIRAAAVSLHHSHAGSEPCQLPIPQLTAMPDPQSTE